MSRTPQQAARSLSAAKIRDGYRPEALHTYTDPDGNPLYWRIRMKHPETGEKFIRPMKMIGEGYTLGEPDYTDGKPLYRLHDLAARPDGPVFICEGEWCVDALHKRGVLATTSGAADSAGKADWKPLAGREVIIWPDNDEAGQHYAHDAMECLRAVGCTVRLVDVGSLKLPPKGDAVNWLAIHPNATAADVLGLPTLAMGEHQPEPENAPAGEYVRSVDLIRASDVTPEAIAWLWDSWLATGKMHVFGGAAGTGKTTISMGLAATVTTGGRWPDGRRSPVGNVVIWSGEDDPADTLIPRLALSGADLSRAYFIADIREGNERRSFDPARDMEPLRRKLAEIGDVRLMIIDPIVSAIAGDSHKNAEVRRGLQPLVDLAASMRCALLGITHFSKGTGGRDPVERLTGSLAFGALARVVLVAAKHQEEGDDGRSVRLFCRAKSNIGPDDGGFEYELHQAELETHPGIFASSVLWGEAVAGAARELLAIADATSDQIEGDSVASVAKWLQELLTEEGGRIDRRDVMKAAHAMGHKERTVHRAREKLGITVQQSGFGKGKRSIWALANSSMSASIVPIVPNKLSGTHGTNGGTYEGSSIMEIEI
jgi:putative DNA primase/helicase